MIVLLFWSYIILCPLLSGSVSWSVIFSIAAVVDLFLGEFLLLLYVGVEATMTLVGGLDPPRDRRFVAEQHKTPPPPTYVQG